MQLAPQAAPYVCWALTSDAFQVVNRVKQMTILTEDRSAGASCCSHSPHYVTTSYDFAGH